MSNLVGQKIERLGEKSFDIYSILFHEQNKVCTALTTIVCYDFLRIILVSDG